MKKILFALTLLLASNAFAATGTGEAQAELTRPLTVTNLVDVTFPTVAVDPAAGTQVIESVNDCPAAYVCTGTKMYGYIQVRGAPSTQVYASVSGEIATLSDGAGNTIVFDPFFASGPGYETVSPVLNTSGSGALSTDGSITLTGNEPAGTYNTANAGGSGFQITVNY